MAKGWSRNLYVKTGYPDNYTPDDCFLAAIQRNKHVNRYNFVQCCTHTANVTMQVCLVILFLVSYYSLKITLMSAPRLLLVAGLTSTLSYLFVLKNGQDELLVELRHIAIFLSFGFGLAPVLFKLTDTISSDTIDTMSYSALTLHLLMHDYHCSASAYASNGLSLNAALFASVCLASRLNSSRDAFVLMTVAVAAFVLFPLLRQQFARQGIILQMTTVLVACTLILAWTVSPLLTLASAVLMLTVNLVAPYLFVRWQSHKDTIHGPWDEAVPRVW